MAFAIHQYKTPYPSRDTKNRIVCFHSILMSITRNLSKTPAQIKIIKRLQMRYTQRPLKSMLSLHYESSKQSVSLSLYHTVTFALPNNVHAQTTFEI